MEGSELPMNGLNGAKTIPSLQLLVRRQKGGILDTPDGLSGL